MKLTQQNIATINQSLLKSGMSYLDIRIELIDHMASELEQMEGDFQDVFPDYFARKKEFIKSSNLSIAKEAIRKGYMHLFKKLISFTFVLGWIAITILIGYISGAGGKEWFLQNFDILPYAIPMPISFILIYKLLFSKNISTDMVGVLFGANFIFMFYMMTFTNMIRKMDNNLWILLFSFFMTLSIAYYFFYFESRTIHNRKYQSLTRL